MSAPNAQAVVIDASIVTKLVIPEELSSRAHELVEHALRNGQRLVGAPALPIEVAALLWTYARREQLTADEVDEALKIVGRLGIDLVDDPEVLAATMRFTRKQRLKQLGDAYPAVLAQRLGGELWTGERGLYKVLSPIAPWVRWIGDFEGGGGVSQD